jgi:hypothetical protein
LPDLLRTGIAQVVEPFVVNGESEGILAVVVRDLKDEDGVVIITRPRGNLRGIASVGLDHQPGEFVKEAVFPRDEDKAVLVGGLFEFVGELVNLGIAVAGVDGELAADGGRLDGHKRTEIIEVAAVGLLRGIRRKDERGVSVLGKKHVGQRERPVQSAAVQVPEAFRRFFSMPNGDNRFDIGIRRRDGGVSLPVDRSKKRGKKDKANNDGKALEIERSLTLGGMEDQEHLQRTLLH